MAMILVTLLAVLTLSSGTPLKKDYVGPRCYTDSCISSAGYLSSSMDFSVNPCDDFYQFSCGKWQEDHPFPANLDGWDYFQKLLYSMRTDLRKILDNTTTIGKDEPKAMSKLYDFYNGCVDESKRNSKGYSSLIDKIEAIGGWPSVDPQWSEESYDWEEAIVKLVKLNVFPIIDFQVVMDAKDSSHPMIEIGPHFATSKGSESYSNKRDKQNTIQFENFANDSNEDQYLNIVKTFIQMIYNNKVVINETELLADLSATTQMVTKFQNAKTKTISTDYYMKHYNEFKFKVKDLFVIYPTFQWESLLRKIFPNLGPEDTIFIPDINFVHKFPEIIRTTEKRALANYFAIITITNLGEHTTTKMYEFINDEKLDAPEILPNICYGYLKDLLPDLLGRLFVDKYFSPKYVREMNGLTKLVQKSFFTSITENEWMDIQTKAEAMRKVDYIKHKVAYPEWTMSDYLLQEYYQSYNDISIDNYFTSAVNVMEAKQTQDLSQINRHFAAKSELQIIDNWSSKSAFDVNAYYIFQENAIYFPAGIAQYPFYMMDRPWAMNLGSIGMIMAHEMTHALDIQGSLYDFRGDLRNWWSESSRKTFTDKSQCFVNQYNSYRFPEQNMTVNGSLTLGENIADNGGIREAYRALKTYQRQRSGQFERLPGKMDQFDEEQLFFISFANMWCSNNLPNAVKKTLESGAHPPESVRVDGSLANFDKFSDAFHCKPGSKMFRQPEERCILW